MANGAYHRCSDVIHVVVVIATPPVGVTGSVAGVFSVWDVQPVGVSPFALAWHFQYVLCRCSTALSPGRGGVILPGNMGDSQNVRSTGQGIKLAAVLI